MDGKSFKNLKALISILENEIISTTTLRETMSFIDSKLLHYCFILQNFGIINKIRGQKSIIMAKINNIYLIELSLALMFA